MGFWKTERGIGGDGWADEMGRCMKALSKDCIPRKKNGEGNPVKAHEITMQEFADLIEFCSRGHIIAEVRYPETNGNKPLSELHCSGIKTYPNRGQIHCKALEE